MAETIKGITIKINGDVQPLSKALTSVNSETKSLQKELNGVNSLLKLDPGNVELLTQKQELLTASIDATKNKLDALKQAKEKADSEMQNGTELNEAEYRNLVREIASTENKLKNLTKESQNFGSVGKQQVANFASELDAAGKKIEDVGKKFSGISAVAGGAVTGLVGLAVGAGKSADDINTLSKVTGIATDEIQKIQYASDLVDVSFETISGSMVKMKNNMQSARDGSESLQNAFDRMGVSITNSDGTLRDSNDVFYEAIEALGRVENATERDTLAMDIFGKSAQDLNPLILGGADALKEYGQQFEESGLILSQEDLDKINAFNDEIDMMKAQLSGTAQVLGAELGEVFMPILQSVAEWLSNVLEWVRGLDEGTLTLITTILAVVAAVAPVLIILGTFAQKISAIISVVNTLSPILSKLPVLFAAITSPVGLVVIGITALIAIIVTLYTKCEWFRDFINKTLDFLKEKFGFVFDTIKQLFDAFTKLFEGDFRGFLEGILNAATTWLSGWAKIGEDLVKGLWSGITNVKDWIMDKISEFCDGIVDGIKGFFGIHSPSTETAEVGKNLVFGLAKGVIDNTKTAVDAMKDFGKKILSETDGILSQSAEQAAGSISGLDDLSSTINMTQDAAGYGIYGESTSVIDYESIVKILTEALLEGFTFMGNSIYEGLPKLLELYINGIKVAKTTWGDFVEEGSRRNKIFAPSYNDIYNIALEAAATLIP